MCSCAWGWCVTQLVCHPASVSPNWSVTQLVCHPTSVSTYWCVNLLVCHLTGVSPQLVCHPNWCHPAEPPPSPLQGPCCAGVTLSSWSAGHRVEPQ